ncbi:MAG: hypothetical protein JWR90_2630 [Marmoricola sp.]|nr:hypothetical protein [Marmoricola sp.]
MKQQTRPVHDVRSAGAPGRGVPTLPAVPRLVLAALLASPVLAVVLCVAVLGLGTTLQVAGVLALLVIAFGAAALGTLALVLRRRLAELKHLPDLGQGFVTHHQPAVVTSVGRADSGDVMIEISSTSQETMLLDETGAPDQVRQQDGGRSAWRIMGSAGMVPDDLERLRSLQQDQVPVRVVSRGMVALTGPVATSWRLQADNGVVVESRC